MNNVRVGKIADLVREIVFPAFSSALNRIRTVQDNAFNEAVDKFKASGFEKFNKQLNEIGDELSVASLRHDDEEHALREKQRKENEKIEKKRLPIMKEALKKGFSSVNEGGYNKKYTTTICSISGTNNLYISFDKLDVISENLDKTYIPILDRLNGFINEVEDLLVNAWTIEEQKELRNFINRVNHLKAVAKSTFPE